MKFFSANSKVEHRKSSVEGQIPGSRPSTLDPRRASGFTMIEIAISLAIIGIALVGIIGVLPLGMNVQRDNREETVINQDASVLLEAIRSGARGLNDLTNYVYAITNYWTLYNSDGTVNPQKIDGYSYSSSQITKITTTPFFPITNGLRIIGLLSTPEFTDLNFNPTNNLFSGGYSNHVVAYVRSMSGPAVEKPPQDNQLLQADSFGYRILCVNAPVAMDTNIFNTNIFSIFPLDPRRAYYDQLAANQHELRMTFLWPQQPNGNVGAGHQTFRSLIVGQVATISDPVTPNVPVYFYQSQSFTGAP